MGTLGRPSQAKEEVAPLVAGVSLGGPPRDHQRTPTRALVASTGFMLGRISAWPAALRAPPITHDPAPRAARGCVPARERGQTDRRPDPAYRRTNANHGDESCRGSRQPDPGTAIR